MMTSETQGQKVQRWLQPGTAEDYRKELIVHRLKSYMILSAQIVTMSF